MSVRVRFAPSPTGYLHVGGLRTALYNWLFARKNGGTFVLRIEDTDQSRKVDGAVEMLMDALQWAGIDVDEGPANPGEFGPYTQSERLDIYRDHIDQLIDAGHAYYCFCTTERLDELRGRQRKMGIATKYDGNCRHLSPDDAHKRAETEPHVVRLAIPEAGRIIFRDIIRKKVAFDWITVDDQVLLKGDGFPTYHLANVVDDHLMGITHVIRGEEWLPSMPKHLLLYEAFGWEPPQFAHLPLLLNPDRSKLSKRQGDVAVEDYKDKGILPQALVNFVALLGWHDQSNKEVFSLDELVEKFDIGRVQKSGAIFDKEKLQWINGQHLRLMDFPAFKKAALPHLDPAWDVTDAMLAAVQGKINLLPDVKDHLAFFFHDKVSFTEDGGEAIKGTQAAAIFAQVSQAMDECTDFSGQWFLDTVKAVGNDFDMKGKQLWHPIRAAITGSVTGPDIVTIVEAFGLETCNTRIKAAVELNTAG